MESLRASGDVLPVALALGGPSPMLVKACAVTEIRDPASDHVD